MERATIGSREGPGAEAWAMGRDNAVDVLATRSFWLFFPTARLKEIVSLWLLQPADGLPPAGSFLALLDDLHVGEVHLRAPSASR